MIGRRSFVAALLGALTLRRWPKFASPTMMWDPRETPQLARRRTRHIVLDLTLQPQSVEIFRTAFENGDRLTVDMGGGRVYRHARVVTYRQTSHNVFVSLHAPQ